MAGRVSVHHAGIDNIFLKNLQVPDLRILCTHPEGQSVNINANWPALRLFVRVRGHDVPSGV
jgi:hypothetical protein